jgi:uncharacterized small protein (DUF1192 family)
MQLPCKLQCIQDEPFSQDVATHPEDIATVEEIDQRIAALTSSLASRKRTLESSLA